MAYSEDKKVLRKKLVRVAIYFGYVSNFFINVYNSQKWYKSNPDPQYNFSRLVCYFFLDTRPGVLCFGLYLHNGILYFWWWVKR